MKALTALVVAAVLGTGAYLNQPTTEIISYQKQVEEGGYPLGHLQRD